MKRTRILAALGALVLASLACQAVMGGGNRNNDNNPSSNGNQPTPEAVQPTQASGENSNNSTPTLDTDFAMTADAFNVMDIGDGSILYYTKLSAEDAMNFFREEYTKRGYTERKILTIVSDGTFSMVFDGDPSGKSVVIQSVDMGDGSRTITMRLEKVE